MNNVELFNNKKLNLKVRTILNEDGSISINAEDTAIGFGWSRIEIKNNKQYMSIRWETLNNYCKEFGFANKLAKDDYIPESLFYLLGMKANNKVALQFQQWLALDVLPKIRKTGEYKIYKEQKPQSLIEYDDKIQNVEKRVEKLEDTMTIDYGQQNDLRMLGNSVVVSALGGYESNAYKAMGKKVFARLWKDYKIYFKVNSYKNTPRKKYFEAQDYITNWKPDANTSIMIKKFNAQMEVGALA